MKLLISLTAISLSMFLCSCKEEPEVFKESLLSLDNYTNRFKKPIETFRFANGGGLNITTRRGNLVSVPANAFVYRNGSPVVGEVTFKVREVFTKTEMFGSGIFPVTANNEPLISGGQMCFEASQGGAPLALAPGKNISYEFFSSNTDLNVAMELFVADGPIDADSLVWETTTNDSSLFQMMQEREGQPNYGLSVDSLSWYNCDVFWGLTTHEMHFVLEGILDRSDIKASVYGFVKDENSALKTYGPTLNDGEVRFYSELIEVEFAMLAIALQDGELYYALKTITPTEPDTITLELEKILSVDLDEIIEGL